MRIIDKGITEKSGGYFIPRIALAVAAVILVTCALVAGLTIRQSYHDVKDAHLDRAREEAVIAFRAAIHADIYPTLAQKIEFGDYLTTISNVAGGAYFDSVGEFVGQFGTKTQLTWHIAKLSRTDRVFVDDGQMMEVFIDPNEVDLDVGITLRFDLTEVWQEIDAEMTRKITAILAVTLATSAATTVLIMGIVLLPINRMRVAIQYTLDDPKDALSNSLNLRRRDEIGQLARGLDKVFYVLSNVFEEDLGNALAVQSHIPYPLIIYTADGDVEDANPAALDFFKATTPADIQEMGQDILRTDAITTSVRDSLEAGRRCDYGEVLRDGEWVPCMVGGHIIRRQTGEVRRYFLIIVDLSVAQTQIDEAVEERATALAEANVLRARNWEMRHLLDASLAIMEGSRPAEKGRSRPNTLPEKAINIWYREAVEHGLMEDGKLRHSVLPSIELGLTDAQRLFTNALSTIYTRSDVESPSILVRSRNRPGGFLEFTIHEVMADGTSQASISKNIDANANLYIAAFNNILTRHGGRAVRSSGPHGENTLVFQVSAAKTSALAEKAGLGVGRKNSRAA